MYRTMDCNIYSAVPLLLILALALVDIKGQQIEECPTRQAHLAGRTCRKSCEKDNDCVSSRKSCRCDGFCGLSCVNENLRCPDTNQAIPNGRMEFDPNNKFGSFAKYYCNDGYILKGMQARVCQADGTWSGNVPVCIVDRTIEATECKKPPDVHHAMHDGAIGQETYALGTMLQYQCTDNYTLSRDSVTRAWCVGGGLWVGPNMTCGHPGCPLDLEIDNGYVTIDKADGGVARYHCKKGYFLAGRSERRCLSSGKWDGYPPSCEAVTCTKPPVVEHAIHNGQIDQEYYPSGTQLTYSCDYGYSPHGNPRTMCNGDSQWVGLDLECIPRNCGFPGDVENGYRRGYLFTYGHQVTYYCDVGFELNGSPIRTCEGTGVWSGNLPSCIPIECSHLSAPQFGIMSGAGNTYGTVLRFDCDKKFQLVGSAERRCLADRTWSGEETRCEEINCGWPGPFWNGYLIGHKTTVGATIFFSCNIRTTFQGNDFQAICLANGTWSSQPPICLGQCQVPAIPNASLTEGRESVWLNHGSTIRYTCKDGLVPKSSSEVRCDNGTWTSLPECVPSPCAVPPPVINDGMRIFLGQAHGYRAKYKCFPGYRLAGMERDSPYLSCNYGEWVGGKPRCEEAYCDNPGSIEHGIAYKKGVEGKFIFKHYIRTIKHGTRLVYECNQGYRLVGPSGATCVNGEWQPNLRDPGTKCVEETHPPILKLWRPIQEMEKQSK
ncbi:hypothetical protein CHS0354_008348 [Potamilus streckersoni]|uniref:Sushi domain-containing protein n=1 Tax=Potamilus streckersoni TaxID=2493646 RepID=A0AAE0SCB1_9BIVA|nr:hypothetical protein CHS0354_008348 [Potamilus streckersoni]